VQPEDGDLETNATWCDQHRCSANFVVPSRDYPGYIGFTDAKVVLATFGKPARTYHVGADTDWSGTRSCWAALSC
jgi:hypothetical protein